MGEPRRKYSEEFKKNAVARMLECRNVKALAAELGIRRKFLYQWRNEQGATKEMRAREPVGSRPNAPAVEDAATKRIAELERLLGRKQLELDFFKQAFEHVRGIPVKKATGGAKPSIAASTSGSSSKED